MKRYAFKRLETGLLVMTAVLFLYAPASAAKTSEESPELRCRALELVQELAEWFETTFAEK